MEGDFFVNNIILSAVELPGYLAVILLMDVWGRKPLFTLTLLFTGVSSIVSSALLNLSVTPFFFSTLPLHSPSPL